ncbi:MAG TPA: tetratricopeptide repeat protein [Tepidisphaeraceae bacterium]|nr:tetratricopeptide repeat protein [Tepidisphaeraceae bacterium]
MRLRFASIVLTGLLIGGGCAAGGRDVRPRAQAAAAPATRPANLAANLTLDQIEPRPTLPKAHPTTGPAPIESLVLYARSRDAMAQNQRYSAINLIEQALQIDPDSFDLNYALGRAYIGTGGLTDRAISAFERAAEIQPNNLEIQTELGRAYQTRNDSAKAIERFRLAMQTEDYAAGDSLAAVVDYRLGLLLEQKGNSRAALECYLHLLNRLQYPSPGTRASPEVNYLLSRPELVYEAIGHLQELLGEYEEALRTYQHVADHATGELAPQAWIIQVLLKLHRNNEALSAATDVVRTFHASPESIALLRDVHEKTGSAQHFTDALRELYRQHPDDKAILFALADTLAGSGHLPQAAEMLARGVDVSGANIEVIQRLYHLWADRDETTEAIRLIVRTSAVHPESTGEVQDLFSDLARPSRKVPLRLAALQKLAVPPAEQAALQYWIWQLATMTGRTAVARASLEQSASATPVFDPACRTLLTIYLNRTDVNPQTRQQSAQTLINSVRSRGRNDLAMELTGLMELGANQNEQALRDFNEAISLSPRSIGSPDLRLEHALSVQRQGDLGRFETLLWKLLGDRPHYTAAYELLLAYYQQSGNESQEWTLINSWLGAEPSSVPARLNLVKGLLSQHRDEDALAQMRRLFDDHPDDAAVVGNLISLLRSANQVQQLMELLEAERTRHPGNRPVVESLVLLYSRDNRLNDATRVLDAARIAVATDPDQLYFVAGLYHQIDQPQMTEQILQDVLKLDPNHPQAGNDLGYTWADAGKNLDRAESMIRSAVKAEPENTSYLDSLGWVLYKRSHFDQAAPIFEQASQPLEDADPVVLDHMGDNLYRLGRAADARQSWQRSLQKMGDQPERKDLRDLRLILQSKIRQADANQSVDVAPVAEAPQSREQAKN